MKILIIGQAPPAVKQTVPYDTTMLYEMLEWVGITKEQAQEIFEFEAVVDKFPGHGENGHLVPNLKDITEYYNKTLKLKIEKAERIIVLGKVAENSLKSLNAFQNKTSVLYMIHPSRMNMGRILAKKIEITNKLEQFI
jgi:uracil-DNA glycosylase